MEDMDTQLRSQLEKIISQRNQLSAEKAASDIEVSTQHLAANCPYAQPAYLICACASCHQAATR